MYRNTAIVILGSFLLLITAVCSGYDLANPQGWWNLNGTERYRRLGNEFAAYANYYASTRGYRFGIGAQDMFDSQFADRAATEIMNQKPGNFEKARSEIRSNIRILIDRMIIEAQSDPNYSRNNPGVIGEMTLSRALSFLCPLWPFCD